MYSPLAELDPEFTPAHRVNSSDPRADRGGLAWNVLHPGVTDVSRAACGFRHGAGNEAAAADDWKAQMESMDEVQRQHFKAFSMDMNRDAVKKVRTKRERELREFEADKQLEKWMTNLEDLERTPFSAEQVYEEKKKMKTDGLVSAGAAASGPVTTGIPGGGVRGFGSSGLREVWDPDGRFYSTDVKQGGLAIAISNVTLARSMPRERLNKGLNFCGLVWSLEKFMTHLAEQRNRLQLQVYVPRTDQYYGLQVWFKVAALPAFKDKVLLEKVLRWEWNIGSLEICYLQFIQHGIASAKIDNEYTHIQALKAIQIILWIFYGPYWEHFLEPVIRRFETDLVHYTRPTSTVDEHLMLTDMINGAFGVASVMMRSRDQRGSFLTHGDNQAVATVVEDVVDIFKTHVVGAVNTVTAANALQAYRDSGRLADFKLQYEQLVKPGAKKTNVANTGEAGVKKETTPAKDKEARPAQKLCMRNVLLQWNFEAEDSWKSCPTKCPFEHIPVGNITRSSLDAALLRCDKLFGPTWSSGNWDAKVEAAFRTKEGARQRPVYLPNGSPVPSKIPGGGRGGDRSGGRNGGRGRGGGQASGSAAGIDG